MRGLRRSVIEVLMFSVLLVPGAAAQDYAIDWYTIDGGGEMWSTGGDFELHGTIGQPDAGEMSGGTFSLTGGFWPGVPCAPACTCGDLDGSGGKVNLSDFNKFAVCFGLRAPTPQCPQEEFDCADLNQDDWINLTDFNTFQVLFGTVNSNSPPNCGS